MKPSISPVKVITLVTLVFGAWLLLSGIYYPRLLIFGLLSTAFAVFFAFRMELVDEEGVPLAHLTFRVWAYLPWLVWQVILSNLDVVRIVLRREMPISPVMVRFRGRPRTSLGRFILANSLTLTPGTLTTGIEGDLFEVHALSAAGIEGLEESEMNRRVAALERPGPLT